MIFGLICVEEDGAEKVSGRCDARDDTEVNYKPSGLWRLIYSDEGHDYRGDNFIGLDTAGRKFKVISLVRQLLVTALGVFTPRSAGK